MKIFTSSVMSIKNEDCELCITGGSIKIKYNNGKVNVISCDSIQSMGIDCIENNEGCLLINRTYIDKFALADLQRLIDCIC